MRRTVIALSALALLLASAGCAHVREYDRTASAAPATTVVTSGATTTVVTTAPAVPWCGGAYVAGTGSNFWPCPK